ncbi:MAG: hypothetical protein IIT58_01210 [Treponema sp.]|nr:hypothetical protein [Treponema sp.]
MMLTVTLLVSRKDRELISTLLEAKPRISTIGTDCNLSIKQSRTLTGVLHKPCKIEGKVMNISTEIELMADSFKVRVISE